MLWFGKKKEEEVAVTAASGEAARRDSASVSAPAAAPAPAPAPAVAPAPASEPERPPVQEAPAPAPVPQAVEAKPAQPNRKALYYSLMNALYDAVLVVDDKGHVMDSNTRMESVFGYSRDEIWDMPLGELVPGITPRIFAQMMEGLHGDRRVLVNARCHRKDGSSFPGEVGAGLMEMMGERLVVSIRNIEKRKPVKAIIRPAGPPSGGES